MKTYYAPRNRSYATSEDAATMKLDVYLSRKAAEYIKKLSEDIRVPVSRLIAQAIDNEMDAENPFYYPCVEPDTEFVEGQYFGEAQKIFDYLKKFPKGADVETLMLARRDMGIESREVFMYALRELMRTSIVEWYHPKRTIFKYPADYRRLRIIEVKPEELKKSKSRYKPLEEL